MHLSEQITIAASVILGLNLGNCYLASAVTSDRINSSNSERNSGATGTWSSDNSGGTISQHTNIIAQATLTPIRVEAESMTKTTYRIESNSSASGGKILSLVGGASAETGTASFAFAGTSGTYNVIVGYYDDNDGVANLEAKLGNTILNSWDLNQNLGSNVANAQTRVKRTVATGLFVSNGATIQIKGIERQGDHARVDYVDFISVASSPAPSPNTRDKWLWPFASKSIWNMPIGSGASYTPAGIQQSPYLSGDEEYFYKLNAGDPLQPVYGPGAWGQGRCTGTQSMGISLPIPDNLIVPDATTIPYSTPNNASAFLMPDGKTLVQLEPLARCTAGGPIYGYRYSGPNGWTELDIYGDGIGGTHFGSGLSSIGGSIRKGELIGNEPIRHALKVVLWGNKYLYYSASIPGYLWPADRADSNAANQYKGTNPSFVQGSLLAIPPSVTEASLNLETPAAKKMFRALQDYGAYVVDDAGWDAHYFAVEKGVFEEFSATFGYSFSTGGGAFYNDLTKIYKALHIIDNNAPNNVGGGGTPRAPLAPSIGN